MEQAKKLGAEGAAFGRHAGSFETFAKLTITETAAVDPLYETLTKGAGTPELADLGKQLVNHENSLRDWLRSELAGSSDGGEKVFLYLEQHGISREEAITPRKERDDHGGEQQHLVLASFPREDAADEAAHLVRNWEKAMSPSV